MLGNVDVVKLQIPGGLPEMSRMVQVIGITLDVASSGWEPSTRVPSWDCMFCHAECMQLHDTDGRHLSADLRHAFVLGTPKFAGRVGRIVVTHVVTWRGR